MWNKSLTSSPPRIKGRSSVWSLNERFYQEIAVRVAKPAEPIGEFPPNMVPSGLVLGYSIARGLYIPYDDSAVDGNVALGVIPQELWFYPEDGTGEESMSAMIVMGVLREDEMVGLDSAAKRDLWCPHEGRAILFPTQDFTGHQWHLDVERRARRYEHGA